MAALNMIDRIKQVIRDGDGVEFRAEGQPSDWDERIARAILAVMREPDPSFWRKVTSYGDTAEHNARALWQHMIDAALEDGNA